jgi:hypothetical protein
LAKLTEDCRRASSDHERSCQEAENLKLQLQGYVSEVKRAEELLARKVCEICGGAFALLFISFYFFNMPNSNKKEGFCAAVSVTSLHMWMFVL